MKQILVSSFLIGSLLIPTSNAFGIIGFGLYGGADQITLDETVTIKELGVSQSIVTQFPMDEAYSLGGYVYTNLLPIIDLELDYQLTAGVYDLQYQVFANELLIDETEKYQAAWAKGSFYLTARKKVLGLGLPILGGVKIHAGAGINSHNSIPLVNIDVLEDIRGEDHLYEGFEPKDMEDDIIDYVKDNTISTTGGHVQVGVQVSVLAFDAFLNYRYTMAELFPDKPGYGSLNLMLGLGF